MSELARKTGGTVACNPDAERLLGGGDLVGVFPEGFKGIGKLYADRYKLQRFGRGGFVSAALRTGTPIVPVAIVGGEEIYPMLADIKPLARLLKLPYFPVTPTFPWLGPLGMVPLPSKWLIEFCPPIPTAHLTDSADDPLVVFNLADQVRETIQQTLHTLLERRPDPFGPARLGAQPARRRRCSARPAVTAPATSPAAAVDGTAILTARRPVRKSRTSQPCWRACRSRAAVRVDGHRPAHRAEQRQVVGRVAVGRAAGQVEPFHSGELGDRLGLRRPVHQVTHQPPGVRPVDDLGHRADGTGQAEPGGDHPADLHRGGADQPHPLAGVQVTLGELVGAGPDPGAIISSKISSARCSTSSTRQPCDEGQRGLLGQRHVTGVLPGQQPEPELLPGEPGQVGGGEVVAGGEPTGEPVDRGALHHRVVHVEERRGGRVRCGDRGQVGLRPARSVPLGVGADRHLTAARHATPFLAGTTDASQRG